MAYDWSETVDAQGRPTATLTLRPNRPLTAKGFVTFFAVTAVFVAMPLLSVIGSTVLWILLPFVAVTFCGAWIAIRAHARAPTATEVLTVTPDNVHLVHQPPQGAALVWEGNPYWLRLQIHPEDGPVPDYLTMVAMGRKVELGAFLSPEERRAIKSEIEDRISRFK